MIISDNKKTDKKAYSTSIFSEDLDIYYYQSRRKEVISRRQYNRWHNLSPTSLAHEQKYTEPESRIVLPRNERYRTAVLYRSYCLIRKVLRHNDDGGVEDTEDVKNVVFQMTDKTANSTKSVLVKKFLAESKRAHDPSRIHKRY